MGHSLTDYRPKIKSLIQARFRSTDGSLIPRLVSNHSCHLLPSQTPVTEDCRQQCNKMKKPTRYVSETNISKSLFHNRKAYPSARKMRTARRNESLGFRDSKVRKDVKDLVSIYCHHAQTSPAMILCCADDTMLKTNWAVTKHS